MVDIRLKGKTAIVTGGGRGIGRAICLALAEEGANVVAAARTGKEIEETAELARRKGGKALAVKTDVRRAGDVRRLVAETFRAFGGIDILVNNAGVAYRKFLLDTTTKEYYAIMDTNMKGVFYCTRFALPFLLKSRPGKIINISSGAGKHGVPQLSVYSASKFAMIGFTESLAAELGRAVQVYAVCPGGVDTQMYRALYSDRPILKPEHIAEKVLELCLPGCFVPSGTSIEVYAPSS